jgi:hypothetical protein
VAGWVVVEKFALWLSVGFVAVVGGVAARYDCCRQVFGKFLETGIHVWLVVLAIPYWREGYPPC